MGVLMLDTRFPRILRGRRQRQRLRLSRTVSSRGGRNRVVGIMTVDASALGGEHFAGAGITPEMRVVVTGLETEKEFTRVLLADLPTLDVEAARAEHVAVARGLVAAHPEVGAIVLECTNMPPYRADIQAATGRPVFDITTLVRMVRGAVGPGSAPCLA